MMGISKFRKFYLVGNIEKIQLKSSCKFWSSVFAVVLNFQSHYDIFSKRSKFLDEYLLSAWFGLVYFELIFIHQSTQNTLTQLITLFIVLVSDVTLEVILFINFFTNNVIQIHLSIIHNNCNSVGK